MSNGSAVPARATRANSEGSTASVPELRSIAFYLPQFHPIPENDQWWGPGFTEWSNVVTGRPAFRGHYQPHLPADLGFYDLRLPETRALQADLAKRHGIDAFCYYHYWFHGRQLLDRPFSEVLKSGEPTLPFVLCWANEHWTRAWDGGSNQVLIRQTYSREDDLAHIRWLAEAFADERWLKVDGKPVFLVYKASHLPDARRTTDVWRAECQRLGLGELYLLRVESFQEPTGDPAAFGFDGAVEFQPDTRLLGPRVPSRPVRLLRRLTKTENGYCRHVVHRYRDLVDRSLAQPTPTYRRFPCVTPSWDNSVRRSRALILEGADPAEFRRWLEATVQAFVPFGRDENLLFVNAWNEWAEGNHLEPCQRFRMGYLEAHRDVLARHARRAAGHPVGPEDASRVPAVPAPESRRD